MIARLSLSLRFRALMLAAFIASAAAHAQMAFDDDAFEQNEHIKKQQLEEEFVAAMELMNGRKMGPAVKELKRLAVAGHARSQHLLGLFFRNGMNVRQDAKRAVKWLELSAEQRYPPAMLAYAEACMAGDGIAVDEQRARTLLEPLAAKNWDFPIPMEDFAMVRSIRSHASYMLASLLAEGKGGETDVERALELMKRASNTGSLYASMYLTVEYARGEKMGRDLEMARRYFDLVDLQSFDSMRRGAESVMMEFVDPVVKQELRKEVEELGATFTKDLLRGLRQLAVGFLKPEDEDYDPHFAASLLRIAAEGGDAGAQNRLGQLYWKGLGVERDEQAALQWFGKADAGKSRLGRYNNMALKLQRDPEPQTIDTARNRLSELADTGLFAAQLVLDGEDGISVISDREDLELAQEWAEREDPRARFALIERAARGWLVDRNDKDKKLFKQYLAVGREGYHRAQYEVGRRYYYGTGVKQNYDKALEWLQAAAEQGNGNANFRLGYMLGEGEGVEQNEAKAAEYYEQALAANDMVAANNLAVLYANGKGVEKDAARAMTLYRLAAESGDRHACSNLGHRLLYGEEIEKDSDEGLRWLAKSAEAGYTPATKTLIDYYSLEKETGDMVEFAHWTEKAAEQGEKHAMKQTAFFYQKGLGMPVSKMKAFYWIAKYLNSGLANGYSMRTETVQSEDSWELRSFMPLDYEAVLMYVQLLMDDSWSGYDAETAMDTAGKLFAKTGLFAGRLLLAELHLNPDLPKARSKTALKLLQKVYQDAVSSQSYHVHAAKAAYGLGKLYHSGTHIEPDKKKRAEWLKKAADLGYVGAQFQYAKCLWNGHGVEQNRAVALLYFDHLSRSKHDQATLHLGEWLAEGNKEPDVDTASLLLRLGHMAVQGNLQAKALLESLGLQPPKSDDESPQHDSAPTKDSEADPYAPAALG